MGGVPWTKMKLRKNGLIDEMIPCIALNAMHWLFMLAITSRVFRFTSKSKYHFEAWGVHADRYDRATDQKKNLLSHKR